MLSFSYIYIDILHRLVTCAMNVFENVNPESKTSNIILYTIVLYIRYRSDRHNIWDKYLENSSIKSDQKNNFSTTYSSGCIYKSVL